MLVSHGFIIGKKTVALQKKLFNINFLTVKHSFLLTPVLIFWLASACLLSAQTIVPSERPSFDANMILEDPAIDGNVISDPVWQTITPLREMIQVRPQFGQEASEKTAIRVAYTAKILYVAVVCYDSEPEKIVVSDSRRDADLSDEDSFLFILDTYNDQQNGFLFGTNASGMEYDAQIDNEGEGNFSNNRQQGGVIGGTNLNWDASWEVQTEKDDYGWSAEFAIPLRSLRFNSGSEQTWGVNFQRNISKNSEVAYWASLPIAFTIKRLSLAGKMHGLNLKSPKNLKIIPYGLVQGVDDKTKTSDPISSKSEVGVDLKYSLTPALTLDLTYNTDFAQVEVDDQQVNLDRFNLFFPEKRPFFLENAGQFSVGNPGEVDLFFSRRIGIGEDGDLVPIIGGARVSGKINQTNVGLLNMTTKAVDALSIEQNNFTVARVNHDFATSRSSLGGILVNRSGLGETPDDYNSVYALDGQWGLGKKARITGFVAKSKTPGITDGDHAFNFLAVYDWDGWNLRAGYTEVGEGFNPEVGFLTRPAFKKPEFLIFKQIRYKDAGSFLEIRPHVSYRGYWNFQNKLVTSFLHVDNHWVWKSGFEIHTGINFTTEGVLEPFEISGVAVDIGTYDHQELQWVLFTNPNKKLSFRNRTFIGGYFGGNRTSSANTVNFRMGDKFNSSLIVSYNDLRLPNGNVNPIVGGLRIAYSFTPRMFLQGLYQYNNVSNIQSLNARFGWLQKANTGLFVVLNLVKDRDVTDALHNNSITIKYTYQFDVLGR